MRMTERTRDALTSSDLVEGWRRAGVEEGMAVIAHSSLSIIGSIDGGAATVIGSLRTALGPAGTLVTPTFTWQVTGPDPDHIGVPNSTVIKWRATAPSFPPPVCNPPAWALCLRPCVPSPGACAALTRKYPSLPSAHGPPTSLATRLSDSRPAAPRPSAVCTTSRATSSWSASATTVIRSRRDAGTEPAPEGPSLPTGPRR